MALTVEDGTGLANANAYIDVAFADDYLGTGWAGASATTPDQERAILQATEYADIRWGARLQGRVLKADQALLWPRVGVTLRDGRAVSGVPTAWKRAVALYAQAAAAGSLYPASQTDSAKEITRRRVTVGPITTETQYQGVVTHDSLLKFPQADGLVAPFTIGGGFGGGGVIRN